MERRSGVVLGGALVVLASMSGAAYGDHKDGHPGRSAHVSGTTDTPFVSEHRFVPERVHVLPGATVEFTNDEFNVAGFGAPHSWTVLDPTCDPAGADPCRFDTGVLPPGTGATVDLKGLPAGTYTFICKAGQSGGPTTLVLPPHAREVDGEWTGMVGTLAVAVP